MSERLNKFLESIPAKLAKATVADIAEAKADPAVRKAVVDAKAAIDNLAALSAADAE